MFSKEDQSSFKEKLIKRRQVEEFVIRKKFNVRGQVIKVMHAISLEEIISLTNIDFRIRLYGIL